MCHTVSWGKGGIARPPQSWGLVRVQWIGASPFFFSLYDNAMTYDMLASYQAYKCFLKLVVIVHILPQILCQRQVPSGHSLSSAVVEHRVRWQPCRLTSGLDSTLHSGGSFCGRHQRKKSPFHPQTSNQFADHQLQRSATVEPVESALYRLPGSLPSPFSLSTTPAIRLRRRESPFPIPNTVPFPSQWRICEAAPRCEAPASKYSYAASWADRP